MADVTVARVYDAYGQPYVPEAPVPVMPILDAAVPSPSDRYRGYPSRRLTPENIVAILDEADSGQPYRLIELCEEMVEKDSKIDSVLKSRRAGILGLQWQVMPAKMGEDADQSLQTQANEIAKFCHSALESADYSCALGHMMHAVGLPFAVDWITWGRDRKNRVVPKGFSRIPTKHLKWSWYTNEILVYSPYDPGPFVKGDWGEPLPPYATVRAIDESRGDDLTRAGSLRTLVWAYYFKITIIKTLAAYIERYGLPPRFLKIDDQDFENPARYKLFKQAMMDFVHDLSAVVSKNAEVEVVKIAGQDGVLVFTGAIDYFDKVIAWRLLGHELTSQSSPGSGQLGITAALKVRQDIIEEDCRWQAGIAKRDLLTPMVGWNFGWDAVDAGLVPTLVFDYEPPKDLSIESQTLDRICRLFGSRYQVSRTWVRDTFGHEAPAGMAETDDDALYFDGGAAAGGGSPTSEPSDGAERGDRADVPVIDSQLAVTVPKVAKSKAKPTDPPQAPVDALGSKGTRNWKSATGPWVGQVVAALREVAAQGGTYADARARVVALYPKLAVEDVERILNEGLVLSQLWGRNGG